MLLLKWTLWILYYVNSGDQILSAPTSGFVVAAFCGLWSLVALLSYYLNTVFFVLVVAEVCVLLASQLVI